MQAKLPGVGKSARSTAAGGARLPPGSRAGGSLPRLDNSPPSRRVHSCIMAPGSTISDPLVVSDGEDEGDAAARLKQRGLPVGPQQAVLPAAPERRASGPQLDEEGGDSASEQEASADEAPWGLPVPIAPPQVVAMGPTQEPTAPAPLPAAESVDGAGAEADDVSDGGSEDGGASQERAAAGGSPEPGGPKVPEDAFVRKFWKGLNEDGAAQEDEDGVLATAVAVAEALKAHCAGAPTKSIGIEARALANDLGRNAELRARVLRGEVTATQLVALSARERLTKEKQDELRRIEALALRVGDMTGAERAAEAARRNLAILSGRDDVVPVPAGLLHADAPSGDEEAAACAVPCARTVFSAPASPVAAAHGSPAADDAAVLDFEAFAASYLEAEADEPPAAEVAALQHMLPAPLPAAEPAASPPVAAPAPVPMPPAVTAPVAAAAVAAEPAAECGSRVVQLERVPADAEPADVRAGVAAALGAGGAYQIEGVMVFVEGGGRHSYRFAIVLLRDVPTAQRLRALPVSIVGDRVDVLAEGDAREPLPGATRVRNKPAAPAQPAPPAASKPRGMAAPRDAAAVAAAAVAERGARSVQLTCVPAYAGEVDVRTAVAHALGTGGGGNYLAENARIEDVRMYEDGGRFGYRYADVRLTDVPTAERLRRLPVIVAGQHVEVRAAGERDPRKGAKRVREADTELHPARKSARAATPAVAEEAMDMQHTRLQLLALADPALSATGVRCSRCKEPGFWLQMVQPMPPATTAPTCVACMYTMIAEFKAKNAQNAAMPPQQPAAAVGVVALPAAVAPVVAPAPCPAPPPLLVPMHLVIELQKSGDKKCLAELHPLVAAGATLPAPPQPLMLNFDARYFASEVLTKLVGTAAQRLHAWDVLPAGALGFEPLQEFSDDMFHSSKNNGKTMGGVTHGLPPGGRLYLFPRQEAGDARIALRLPASPHAVMLAVYVAPAPPSLPGAL